jgi:hypothetical protein
MQSCWRDSSESIPECKRGGPNLLMNLNVTHSPKRRSDYESRVRPRELAHWLVVTIMATYQTRRGIECPCRQ